MQYNQPFERLIRLEDEELGAIEEEEDDEEVDHLRSKDSCKVPMIVNDNNGRHYDKANSASSGAANLGSGLSFNFNGSHIHINPAQLKYLSLITLTIQNAALNLTMKAARDQSEKFSIPIAVTVAEFFKLITCLLLILIEESLSLKLAIQSIKSNIIYNYVDTLKVAIPSFVYYIQNNLLYVGSTHLDAATTQVTYQLKILTTAIFSVLMLNKKLSRLQWIALITLFVGVALIETMVVGGDGAKVRANLTNSSVQSAGTNKERPLIGFMAILMACCLSGFAGVYFEKILKNTSHVSLWIRNIQLSVVAIPIGLMQVFVLDSEFYDKHGFFYGFTPLTWLCIILQVQGGLLVAVVVKFANNILKGFATSMAIVISTVASMFLFSFNLTPSFVIGASMVIGSVMMYNKQ